MYTYVLYIHIYTCIINCMQRAYKLFLNICIYIHICKYIILYSSYLLVNYITAIHDNFLKTHCTYYSILYNRDSLSTVLQCLLALIFIIKLASLHCHSRAHWCLMTHMSTLMPHDTREHTDASWHTGAHWCIMTHMSTLMPHDTHEHTDASWHT